MISTSIKKYINNLLSFCNLKLDTLTKEKSEIIRLKRLEKNNHFDNPVYFISQAFKNSDYIDILESTKKYINKFNDFSDSNKNAVKFSYFNDYYSSPDVEVLYTIIREYKPKKIIEIGSGNSSLIIRQAIMDGETDTFFLSIDPNPRININGIADEFIQSQVEFVDENIIIDNLSPGDIVFIDSSHEVTIGNDVLFIYLNLLTKILKGVLIHIHDVFLPFEYPREWIVDNEWKQNEQYLVQSLLLYSRAFEVLWPGYYLQKILQDFNDYFPNIGNRNAQSLWLIKKSDIF